MKHAILITICILSCVICNKACAQYTGIPYYLNKKNQEYETGFRKLQYEYNELMSVELINKTNKALLDKYKANVKDWADQNFKNYDLSIPKTVDDIEKFFTEWRAQKNILQEIELIKAVKAEIIRIKFKDPDNFYTSERYKDMGIVYKKLADCNPNDISQIAWNHGLVNN